MGKRIYSFALLCAVVLARVGARPLSQYQIAFAYHRRQSHCRQTLHEPQSRRQWVLAANSEGNAPSGAASEDFWDKQRQLVAEMNESTTKSLKRYVQHVEERMTSVVEQVLTFSFHTSEQMEKYAKRRAGLISDTAYFTALIFCVLWGVASSPLTAFSYAFGAVLGIAYTYGLSKYVETIGDPGDEEPVEGAGVGQARFAFLALLILFVGKFRGEGLQELPSILGFFTYQLGSLSQGKLFVIIPRSFRAFINIGYRSQGHQRLAWQWSAIIRT